MCLMTSYLEITAFLHFLGRRETVAAERALGRGLERFHRLKAACVLEAVVGRVGRV